MNEKTKIADQRIIYFINLIILIVHVVYFVHLGAIGFVKALDFPLKISFLYLNINLILCFLIFSGIFFKHTFSCILVPYNNKNEHSNDLLCLFRTSSFENQIIIQNIPQIINMNHLNGIAMMVKIITIRTAHKNIFIR